MGNAVCGERTAGKKGYRQRDLNDYMKRSGLYDQWVEMGMSNRAAVTLLLQGREIPVWTTKEDINRFLAHVIKTRMTRSKMT